MSDHSASALEDHHDLAREEIVNLLLSGDTTNTRAAQSKVEALGQQGVELLVSIIRQEMAKRSIRERALRGPRFTSVGIHVALIIGSWLLTAAGKLSGLPFFWLVASGCLVDVVHQLFTFPRALERRATALLAGQDYKESVGILIEALEVPTGEIKAAVMAGLVNILGHLAASDSHLLTLDHVRVLNFELIGSDHYGYVPPITRSNFQIAVLKAYEQIGDAHSLEVVRRITLEKPRAWARERVVEAAKQCLPYLEERIGRDRLNNRLLRPAGANSNEEELLRPATIGAVESPEELLRAVN
jgi:hypothetical protein